MFRWLSRGTDKYRDHSSGGGFQLYLTLSSLALAPVFRISAAGLQLKHFTFTWQFLTQNNLTCNSWLHSLHLVPACNCCTFSAPGRGMPRQSQSTAASSEQLSQCPYRLAIATPCPCRLCLGRCPQPAVALGSISAACQ